MVSLHTLSRGDLWNKSDRMCLPGACIDISLLIFHKMSQTNSNLIVRITSYNFLSYV